MHNLIRAESPEWQSSYMSHVCEFAVLLSKWFVWVHWSHSDWCCFSQGGDNRRGKIMGLGQWHAALFFFQSSTVWGKKQELTFSSNNLLSHYHLHCGLGCYEKLQSNAPPASPVPVKPSMCLYICNQTHNGWWPMVKDGVYGSIQQVNHARGISTTRAVLSVCAWSQLEEQDKWLLCTLLLLRHTLLLVM